MKKIIILVALFWVFCAQAQTTIRFNKRISIGCVNSIFTGIHVTDTCYYIMGNAREDSTCLFGSLFCKVDSLGNILYYKIRLEEETWNANFGSNSQNKLFNTVELFDTSYMRGAIIEYNKNGFVSKITKYDNPTNLGAIRAYDVSLTGNNGYVLNCTIGDTTRGRGGSDIYIIKLGVNGQQEWTRIIGFNNGLKDRYGSIYHDPLKETYTIGYQQDNISLNSTHALIYCHLEQLDSAGNTNWSWSSPLRKQVYSPNDIVQTKDGGWVVASALGWTVPNSNRLSYYSDPYLFKLDSARNLVWEQSFTNGYDQTTQFNKVIELEDSSLVAIGTTNKLYPDTSNPQYGIYQGKIVKVGINGSIVWDREFAYFTTEFAQHRVHDAAGTPDGGFLIAGEAIGGNGGPVQLGWLLKLDEYGCLVPGCQLAAGVLPLSATGAAIELRLFPNPTTQFLNVYHDGEASGEAVIFRIVNIQGQEVQQYATQSGSHKTYMLGVEELPVGVYVLTMYLDGELVGSEQFVKQ